MNPRLVWLGRDLKAGQIKHSWEHPLRQQYLAVLPEDQDAGGGTISRGCVSEQGEIEAHGQWPVSRCWRDLVMDVMF